MKKRIAYLFGNFALLLVLFVVLKALFMLYCGGFNLLDFALVAFHGLQLDMATAAYGTVIPFVVVVISLFFNTFPLRKVMAWYYGLATLLVSVVFCVDTALYPFWNFKLDASIFFYLSSPKEALASVSGGFVALGLLLILLMHLSLLWLFVKTTPRTLHRVTFARWGKLKQSALMLLVAALIFVSMRGGLGKATANVGMCYFCKEEFLNHSAVNPIFSLLYSWSKQEDFSKQFNYLDEVDRQCTVDQLFHLSSGNDTTPILLNTSRPNILLVILEGFGGNLIQELGGIPDATPNFSRLSRQGVFFTQCYAGSYRTDRGLVCLISGYPGLPTTSLMKMPAKTSALPSLAEELRKAGYGTDFLYGGDINFTNMRSYLYSKGYQHLADQAIFSNLDNPWGANDEQTFLYLYQDLAIMPNQEPWHKAFLTLSSHEPFEVPYHRLPEAIPNAFAYTDSCLGDFVDHISKTPVWDNLLMICIADHGFYYPRENERNHPRNYRIPMLWLGGAVKEPRQVDILMNQIDWIATLMAQLGLDHSMFPYSRNVLSSSYNPWVFYTFNNGFCFMDSTGFSLFDNNSRQVILEEPETPSPDRIKKGKAWLQTLYDELDRLVPRNL